MNRRIVVRTFLDSSFYINAGTADTKVPLNYSTNGDLQYVSFTKDGKEAKLFVEANPRLRTINIKDEKGVSVRRDQLEVKDQSKSAKIAETKDQGIKSNKKQGLSV